MRTSQRGLALLLLLTSVAAAQNVDKQRSRIVWGDRSECDRPTTADGAAGGPKCALVEAEGMAFYMIDFHGVTYAMTYRLSRDFVITSVQLSNKSGSAVEVHPLRSKLLRYKDEQEFRAGGRPSDVQDALSADKLRVITFLPEVVAEPEGGIRPGLQVNVIYEERMTRNGRARAAPRVEPKENPADKPRPALTKPELLVPRSVFDFLLRSKTIADKEKAAGHIVFKPGEEQGYFIFQMNAGDFDFLIPIGKIDVASVAKSSQ